jgi:fructose-specific phosphotransferase system IIC component
MKQRLRHNMYWSPAEAGILLLICAVAWAAKQPFIFASLGPTAYELVEQPQLKSARTYNIIVGHFVGLGSGFLALYLLSAWHTPKLLPSGILSMDRMWAVAVAAILTTVLNLVLKSSQPAALSTTLLITLGEMQTGRDAVAIIAGVLLVAIVGEPIRRARLKSVQAEPQNT